MVHATTDKQYTYLLLRVFREAGICREVNEVPTTALIRCPILMFRAATLLS